MSGSQVEDVRRYIEQQEEHHRKLTFQEEFRMSLSRHRLEFDERYVWNRLFVAPLQGFFVLRVAVPGDALG